jgi:hypothetical protein
MPGMITGGRCVLWRGDLCRECNRRREPDVVTWSEPRLNADELRNARLLLDTTPGDGSVAVDLATPALRAAVGVRSVPPRVARLFAQVRYKLGALDYTTSVAEPMLAARRQLLGDDANRPPRFLIRVDEFPHYRAWDEPELVGTARFERFHNILAGAGVPYLLAVLPRVSRDPLSPSATGSRRLEEDEIAMLHRVASAGVSFGLHGHDHRTRFSSPRRHSELCGLDEAHTRALIAQACEEVDAYGVRTEVFVAPYNRFDARQLPLLASRFKVVCGGPESVGLMGFQATPQWRGDAVYLPSYVPFYGRASAMLDAVASMIERAPGLWVPLVLHWEWEQESGWVELERFAELIAPYARDWHEFIAAVDRSAESAAGGESPAGAP